MMAAHTVVKNRRLRKRVSRGGRDIGTSDFLLDKR